jgi:Flp pilus assembly protein TadG
MRSEQSERRFKKGRASGAALVEMAIILPFLLIFLVGLMELGVLFHDKAVITNASREGVRFGINNIGGTPTDTEIETRVNNYLQNYLINFAAASAATSVTRTGADPGNPLTVTVTYTYSFMVLDNLVNLSDTLTLAADTTMRME